MPISFLNYATPNEEEYEKIKLISTKSESNSLIILRSYDQKAKLIGELDPLIPTPLVRPPLRLWTSYDYENKFIIRPKILRSTLAGTCYHFPKR
ncbi:hypothetical protein LguiA_025552 [Lonicera macranthoides]